MSEFIYIFLAGIALTIGLSYAVFSVLKKGSREELLFGLFSSSAGIYYILLTIDSAPNEATLFFATAMFLLFPWYLAHQSNYIKKPFLWLITAFGTAYFLAVLLSNFINIPNFPYFFSYSVYLLTAIYCISCVRSIIKNRNIPLWPFIVVTVYYILFTVEEITSNSTGTILPWRKLISFAYLDLFPIIIIAFKLTLLIYDHWMKTTLEKEVNFYKNNINTILNQTKNFVISLDLNGAVIFVNPYFREFFETGTVLLNSSFDQLLTKETQNVFQREVFESDSSRGDVVCGLKSVQGIRTIAWSYVKLKGDLSRQNEQYITLFGTDISPQIEAKEQLSMAYKQLEVLKNKLQSENIQLRNDTLSNNNYDSVIGKSPNFMYVLNRVEDVAKLDITVLLEGETGVGKEVIANTIHKKSQRKDKPFVIVNCAAIPLELIESELFGYEKGAFTGAERMKRGLFELADNGTLFLDEIGDLPMSMQPKLLRALQEGEIQRLGAEKTIKVDVRILAATNRSLDEEVKLGNFRSDLYYRINVFPITTPPLRKRLEDIPLLVEYFINYFNKKYSRNINTISESLMDAFTSYSWPGNIRQLRNVLESAVITSSESVLKLANSLPLETELLESENEAPFNLNFGSLEDFEKSYIIKVLNHCNWKIAGKNGTAELLGLPPSTLRSKMKKLGIGPVSV